MTVKYLKFYSGTDFCPPKPEIAPSSIGFRLNYTLFMAKTAENLTLWGCMYLYMPYNRVTPGTLP